jgi:hypothetical protein
MIVKLKKGERVSKKIIKEVKNKKNIIYYSKA